MGWLDLCVGLLYEHRFAVLRDAFIGQNITENPVTRLGHFGFNMFLMRALWEAFLNSSSDRLLDCASGEFSSFTGRSTSGLDGMLSVVLLSIAK